jgi:leucyl aminopeptidase
MFLACLIIVDIPNNIVGILCLAENAISAEAYPPSAIIKSYQGMTVEVGNTDAEGRLVLADGITYAKEMYKYVRQHDGRVQSLRLVI